MGFRTAIIVKMFILKRKYGFSVAIKENKPVWKRFYFSWLLMVKAHKLQRR